MQKVKEIIKRILHPAISLSIVLSVICTIALVYIFISGYEETIAAYIVYALTTYSFSVLALRVPIIVAKAKVLVYNNRIGHRLMTDIPFRVKISLYSSLSLNVFYAILKLYAGIHYASFWYGADAIYYIALSVVRLLLTLQVRKNDSDLAQEYRKYRLCGYLLFAMNAALTGVVIQIVSQNMGYAYPGLLIYVVATYTFASMAIAAVNLIKYRKYNSPVLSAVKIISFVRALVAMFALQTAMFASFGDGATFQRVMNIVFGVCVCCTIFYLAVTMVIEANKHLKILSINNTET